MTRYLLTLSGDETAMLSASPEQYAEMMTAHQAWAAAVTEAGATVVAGEALQPSSTATYFRGGVVTDAPLAETKEIVNGFYLLDAPSEAVAQELARSCPSPVAELRPVADLTAGFPG